MNKIINDTFLFSTKISEEYKSKPVPAKYRQCDFVRISQVAGECLQRFNDVNKHRESLSLKGRVEAYRNLSKGLKSAADHIHKSKSLWQKFLSLFTSLSPEEKKLQKVRRAVNRALKATRSKERRLWVGESWILRLLHFFGCGIRKGCKKALNNSRKNLSGRIKAAAFRVLGDHAINSKQIDGGNPYAAFKNIQNDIHKLIAEMEMFLTKKQISSLRTIDEHLEKASLLSLDLMVVHGFQNLPDGLAEPAKNHRERVKDISTKVRKRIENLLPRQNMIIPGGYRRKEGGHAVIYNVRREENGTFTFTIVNTGAGLGHFSGLFSNVYSIFSEKYHDYEIRNLTIEDVANEEFLGKVLDVTLNNDGTVEKMYQPIVKYLAKNNAENITKGRYHWIQKNGTCTHDSVICWMESMMDPQLFQALLLFMTKKGLVDLKKISASQNKGRFASHESSNGKGISPSLMNKIMGYGVDTYKVRKSKFAELNKKTSKKLEGLKSKSSIAEKNKSIAGEKLAKWEERSQDFYLQLLEDRVNLLKHNYCAAAGIDNPKDIKSPHSFFSLSKPKQEIAAAWEAYDAKAKECQKMKKKFALNQYTKKIQQKIAVKKTDLSKWNRESRIRKFKVTEFIRCQNGFSSICTRI